MFDPVIDAIKAFFGMLWAFVLGVAMGIRRLARFIGSSMTFRSPDPADPISLWVKLRRFSGSVVLLVVFGWYGTYFYQALWIRGFSLLYPEAIVHASRFSPGHETTAPESGTADTKSCGRSQLVDMEIYLIRFEVDDNAFIPSLIQHKLGFFGIPWDDTPFFDRKSMFQKGVLKAVRRASIELVDTLGRVRGTSSADPDLEVARGLLQYDMETWRINPFDARRPFLATPSDAVYRKAGLDGEPCGGGDHPQSADRFQWAGGWVGHAGPPRSAGPAHPAGASEHRRDARRPDPLTPTLNMPNIGRPYSSACL